MCEDLPEVCVTWTLGVCTVSKHLGLAMVLRPYPAKDGTGDIPVNRQVSMVKGSIESFALGPFRISTEEHQESRVKAL